MALYYGTSCLAEGLDYMDSDNEWTGANSYAKLSAANASLLGADELKESQFFIFLNGQLRTFEFAELSAALAKKKGGELPADEGVGMNAEESVPILTQYGDFGTSSEVGGRTVWDGAWAYKQIQGLNFASKSSGSNKVGLSFTQSNITKTNITTPNDQVGSTFGDSLSPRFFRYCMISAAWQLTSDTMVYFELPLAPSAACGKVELIGTTSTAHPRGETWGTFYKFKDGDQIGFAKALWEYWGGVPYTRKNGFIQDGGGIFSHMKWFGHGGAKGHPSTKAQVIFGYEPKCFVSRPSLGREYSLD